MKKLICLTAIMMMPMMAFAGKAEREYKKSDLDPAVTAAQAEFKKACGCDLKIKIDDKTLLTTTDMSVAKNSVEDIKNNVGGYCTDDASKKAVCKMKHLDIIKDKEAKFTFKDGHGTACHNGQIFTNFSMMTSELDK